MQSVAVAVPGCASGRAHYLRTVTCALLCAYRPLSLPLVAPVKTIELTGRRLSFNDADEHCRDVVTERQNEALG